MDKAKAWNASAAQQEVNAIRMKSSSSRSFNPSRATHGIFDFY
jgi:hypothetical protein